MSDFRGGQDRFGSPHEPPRRLWLQLLPVVGAVLIVGGSLFIYLMSMNRSLGAVEHGLTAVHEDIDDLDKDIDGLDGDIDDLRDDVEVIGDRTANIEGSLTEHLRQHHPAVASGDPLAW